jgi:hypothetical protein
MRRSNEVLYFGTENTTQSEIYEERKNFTLDDYADLDFEVIIESVTIGTEFITMVISAATFPVIEINQTIRQVSGGETIEALITMQDPTTRTITIDNNTDNWIPGTAIVFSPIVVRVTTTPLVGNSPNIVKQWTELSIIVEGSFFTNLWVSFNNDLNPNPTLPYTVNGQPALLGWGNGPWGDFAWGEEGSAPLRIRTLIPRDVCKCDWIQQTLEARNAFNKMRVSGISLNFRPLSSRIR